MMLICALIVPIVTQLFCITQLFCAATSWASPIQNHQLYRCNLYCVAILLSSGEWWCSFVPLLYPLYLFPQLLELPQFKTIDCTGVLRHHAPLIQRVMTLVLASSSWNPFPDLTQQIWLVYTIGTSAIAVPKTVFPPLLGPRLYFHYNWAQDLCFLPFLYLSPQFLEPLQFKATNCVNRSNLFSFLCTWLWKPKRTSWSSQRTKASRGFHFACDCVLYTFGQLVCGSGKRQVLPHAISIISSISSKARGHFVNLQPAVKHIFLLPIVLLRWDWGNPINFVPAITSRCKNTIYTLATVLPSFACGLFKNCSFFLSSIRITRVVWICLIITRVGENQSSSSQSAIRQL